MAKTNSGGGQSLGGRIFLFIFGLPFLGVGLLMLWMTLSSLSLGIMVKTWPKVPVTIESMHVENHSGSDSTTYELQATYKYQVNGQEYTSNTVGLHTGADNVGKWHQETFDRLEKDRVQERSVAYVNPREPREAYLAPDMRPGMMVFKGIFGLVFGGAGLAMMYGVFGKGLKNTAYKSKNPPVTKRPAAAAATDLDALALAKLRPGSQEGEVGSEKDDEDEDDEDEDDDDDWEEDEDEGEDFVENVPTYSAEERTLKHSHATGIFFMLFFTLIWNGVSWTLVYFFYQQFLDKTKSEPFMWLFIAFPLVGLCLIWGMISTIMRHLRYGTSTLEVATMPGIVGGKFSGAVTCRGSLGDSRSVEVSMSCVKETVTRDSDGDRRTTTATQWHDSYELRADSLPRTGGATTIPVLFAVPYDLPITSDHGNGQIYWKIAVNAVRPGADYSADWRVPVYRTSESVKGYQLESNPLTTFYMDPDPEDALARNGVTIRNTSGGGKSWYFRPTPLRSGAPGCLMFVGILGAVLALMLSAKAAFIAVAIVGLLTIIAFAVFLHMLFGRSEIRIENGELTINGGFAGFNKSTKYPLDLVESVISSNSMTSGDAVYFKLQFIMTDGKKPTAGNQLKGQRLIDALKASVQAELDRVRGGN